MSLRRCLSVFCSVLLVVLCGPVVAHAQQVLDPTVVVLDASGSMTATDVGGVMRMDAAKQAVDGFLSGVPADSPLGLVTYGTGTGSSDEEKEAGCQDIKVLSGVGEKPVDALKAEVAGLEPRGYTPIGNSLLKANELLPKEGARSIVLVSDGIDTCAPPPVCEVAKQLKDQGTDLVVHTIGFMVDEAARAELTCVAEVTGGTYADASTADSLSATLKQATTRTAEGYQLPSETIEFNPDKNTAPVIEVGTLDNPTRINAKISEGLTYAKVSIPEGHRLQVGYNQVPAIGTRAWHDGNITIQAQLKTADDAICKTNFSMINTAADGLPVADKISSEIQGADSTCSGDPYFLEIDANDMAAENLDMMLAAVPEPTDLGDSFNEKAATERSDSDLGQPVAAGEEQEVQALTQWDNSVPEMSGTVVSEIVEGESQYFPVTIGWGQALDVTVEILSDPTGEELAAQGETAGMENSGRSLKFGIQNTLGQDQSLIGKTNESIATDFAEPAVFGTKTPISFANVDNSWLGGRHYVQVGFYSSFRGDDQTDATTQLQPVKYRLTFTPVGQEVTGPNFETDSAVTSSPNTTEQPQAASEEKSGISPIWWIVVITAIVLLAGIIFALSMLSKRPKAR